VRACVRACVCVCYTHVTEATSSFFGIFNVDGCWLSLPVIVHLKKLNDTLFNINI